MTKEQTALNKIIGQLFRQYSLGDYGAMPGTFKVHFPAIDPTTKVLFWGGIEFTMEHPAHGEVRVELIHDSGAFFKVQFFNAEDPAAAYRVVRQIPFDHLDNEGLRMIEEERDGN